MGNAHLRRLRSTIGFHGVARRADGDKAVMSTETSRRTRDEIADAGTDTAINDAAGRASATPTGLRECLRNVSSLTSDLGVYRRCGPLCSAFAAHFALFPPARSPGTVPDGAQRQRRQPPCGFAERAQVAYTQRVGDVSRFWQVRMRE